MMELLLVVCLASAPERCEERSLGLYPELTELTCVMQAQPYIAAWIGSRPELVARRWSCRDSATRITRA